MLKFFAVLIMFNLAMSFQYPKERQVEFQKKHKYHYTRVSDYISDIIYGYNNFVVEVIKKNDIRRIRVMFAGFNIINLKKKEGVIKKYFPDEIFIESYFHQDERVVEGRFIFSIILTSNEACYSSLKKKKIKEEKDIFHGIDKTLDELLN